MDLNPKNIYADTRLGVNIFLRTMNPTLYFPDRERIHGFLDIHPLSPPYKIHEITPNAVAAFIFANSVIPKNSVQFKVYPIVKHFAKELPKESKKRLGDSLVTALVECAEAYMSLRQEPRALKTINLN